jgi:hypothetical protein
LSKLLRPEHCFRPEHWSKAALGGSSPQIQRPWYLTEIGHMPPVHRQGVVQFGHMLVCKLALAARPARLRRNVV